MAIDVTSHHSRRALLAAVFGGLIGVAAQAVRPLVAHAEGEVIHVGDDHFTAQTATRLKNQTTDNDVIRAETLGKGRGILARSDQGVGLEARSDTGTGSLATSAEGYALEARSTDNWAVYARGDGGVWAAGQNRPGVHGLSTRDYGVSASSSATAAVYARSDADDAPSVHALKASVLFDEKTGPAVLGEIRGQSSPSAAIIGMTAGSGPGVRGISEQGRGGLFEGQTAQVRLVPSAAGSHPATGNPGDLFVDKSHRLWFCKGGTTWKQIA